ncbi:MAG: hypothetical protein GXY67_04100 [Clostridiales bacterium]|nr:hypothetical protein [Clostridiales bacterium]
MSNHALSNAKGDRRARLWICLFFIIVLLLGFFTAGNYGQPWDEPDEINILRMNLWQYAIALRADTAAFKAWAARESTSPIRLLETPVPISQSQERDHGQSAYYPLASVVMDDTLSPAQRMEIWHLYTWVLFWLGALALYFVCRRLGLSRPLSCLAVLMLLLSPRFFAEGHYNNKDLPLFSFCLLCLWQSLHLMERPRWDAAILLGLFGALAANTKVVGLALWGLCGLAVVFQLILQKQWSLWALGIGLLSVLSFIIFYVLLTPALWKQPMAFLGYVLKNAIGFSRWKNEVLFRGAVFDTAFQPLPRYYLPYMMLVTTPLWVLLPLSLGQCLAAGRVFTRRPSPLRVPLLLCSLLWLLPLAFAVITRTSVYNGWRHFYFLYGPMVALAAYGLSRLWARIRSSKPWRVLLPGLLSLSMAVTGVGMALNHPYEFPYYNPLVLGKDINTFLERDYWNVSIMDVVRQLEQDPAVGEARNPVTIAGVDFWAQAGLDRAMAVLGSSNLRSVKSQNHSPDFWLVNHTYTAFSHWKPSQGMRLKTQILSYGAPLVSVYERVPQAAAPSP